MGTQGGPLKIPMRAHVGVMWPNSHFKFGGDHAFKGSRMGQRDFGFRV